ncbi:ABC transporter permease [Paenibacillus beijingensis]|uniref:Multidrug ABC transporter permease n=1 Tax=Paenibacillus beijingensis TaxID=1126833 RepID=A0A0D5NGN0_9BACL|nr:ABC transporter permease [Paenibacillus beijingensis]AJY74078.1 multidrug ABC transporter permease [Paenibacillus beijingensis]
MIKSLIVKEIKLVLKEKGTFFWLLLLPMLFIVLFGSILGNMGSSSSITIAYIDQDGSEHSAAFLKTLADKSGYTLESHPAADYDNQVSEIRKGNGTALLVVPKGFGEGLGSGASSVNLELYRDATADATIAPLRAVLENLASGYKEARVNAALAEAGRTQSQIDNLQTAPFGVNDHRENAESYDAISQVVPGYTVMFVFFVNISMIRRFMTDRESGMTARLRTTAMKPISYLIGMWVPYALIAIVQCTVLLGFGHFVYGLKLGDVGAVAVLVVVLALCGTAIGLMLAMIVSSENMGMAFTQIITMGGAALGGLWVPTAYMPKVVQLIGKFTPQYWAQVGLQNIMIRGSHLAGVWISLVVLGGIAVVALAVALGRYKAFLKTAVA